MQSDWRVDHREETGDQRIGSGQVAIGLRAAARHCASGRCDRAMQLPELTRQRGVECRRVGITRGQRELVGAHQARVIMQRRVAGSSSRRSAVAIGNQLLIVREFLQQLRAFAQGIAGAPSRTSGSGCAAPAWMRVRATAACR